MTCRARGRPFILDDASHAVIHDAEIVALGVKDVMGHLPPRTYGAGGPVRYATSTPETP